MVKMGINVHQRVIIKAYYANIFCPVNVVCFFTSDAYIEVYFRQDFFMEANSMSPDQGKQPDLGPY